MADSPNTQLAAERDGMVSAAAASREGASVLLLVLSLPLPPRGGVDLRAQQVVAALGRNGPVGVFGLVKRPGGAPTMEGVEAWETTSDPFLSEGAPRGTELAWMREPGALPTDHYISAEAARELSEALTRQRPEVVVIDQLWLHSYIDVARSHGCHVVLNHHNSETSLHVQMANAAIGPERLIRKTLSDRVRTVEASVLDAVDQVWTCSGGDRDELIAEFNPAAEIVVVPNTVEVDAYAAARDRSAAESGGLTVEHDSVLFPANFAYEPNRRAASFLLDEVYPALTDRHPRVKLVLAGRSPTPAMLAAADRDPNVTVTGSVPDMLPFLAAAGVVVAPLLEGSGTRIKILEAFASGVPVVSTGVGAAGLPVEDGVHLSLANDAADVAAAIGALLDDPETARSQAVRALELVVEELSWEKSAEIVAEALRRLVER